MTTGTVEPSAPVVEAPAKNSFQRIVGALFAPAETFRDIARKPDILVPLILIVLIGYASTFIVLPKMDWDAIVAQQAEAMQKQNPNLSDSDVERMGKITRSAGTVMAYVMPLVMIVWYVIVAGVLLLIFRLFGGEGTFKQAFSTTLYAWMPMVLAAIIGTVVIAARGDLVDPTTMATLVKSNPAFLVDPKEQAALFAMLSSFDIFTFWTLALLIIGFATMSRTSKGKAAGIVLPLWIVLVVIKVGFAALGAARAKA